MSDTYSYEVLEPGGHARLVGNVLDRISRASANSASAVGSSRAMLGDPETASWMERTTAADGAALIEAVQGNTIVQDGSLLPVRMEGIETVAADESWSSQRTIPAATYFPQGMRSAGSVYDELRADAAVTRVGAVDHTSNWSLGTSTVNSHGIGYVEMRVNLSGSGSFTDGAKKITSNINISTTAFANSTEREFAFNDVTLFYRFPATEPVTLDAAIADMEAHGAVCFYALATPTTTPIDPPLPLSYRVGAGGTERVMVASGTTSAPPIFVTSYPLDPADLAASIAPVDGPIAKTNHQVGDLLMLGFTLCKATQVIVTGETIAIGTNVTKTTVAAELAALSE